MCIRDFAAQDLILPDNDSYRSYTDLQRPFIVWNVFAAPPFELELIPFSALIVALNH